MKTRTGVLRWSVSTAFGLAPLAALAACRGVLGIDDLPRLAAGSSSAVDAADEAAGAYRPDPAWASWRVPADVSPRYELTSAGVARDLVSGLVWQRASMPPASWSESAAACEGLDVEEGSEAGAWRLPTRIELLSLADFDLPIGFNPFADPFLDPEVSCYWTISEETDRISHWLLATVGGQVGISVRDSQECAARCVRGAPYDYEANAPPDYVIEEGVVRDPHTQLEWQASESGATNKLVSFATADDRCRESRLLGHADWRLPTVKELATLVDERRALPALDERVEGEPNLYWTSTVHAPTQTDAPDGGDAPRWRVHFADGTVNAGDDETVSPGIALVRCVRNY